MTYESSIEPGQITSTVLDRAAEQALKASGGKIESEYQYNPESAALEIVKKEKDIEAAKESLSEAQNRFVRSFEEGAAQKKQEDIDRSKNNIRTLKEAQKQFFNGACMTLFLNEWPDFAFEHGLSRDIDYKKAPKEISEQLRYDVERHMNSLVNQAKFDREQQQAGFQPQNKPS